MQPLYSDVSSERSLTQQRRSEKTVDAWAQHGTLNFVTELYKELRGSGGMLLQKIFQVGSEAILDHTVTLNHVMPSYRYVCGVENHFTTYNKLVYIEIREAKKLRIQIAIRFQYPSCIFSAQFTIDSITFGADNFQAHLHRWDTASSCYGMCPSVPRLGYIATVTLHLS